MRVLKFGGTSVGSVERIRTVCEIVQRAVAETRVTVVVSAMGGVTNRLVTAVERALAGESGNKELIEELAQRHLDALQELARPEDVPGITKLIRQRLEQLDALLDGIALLGECWPSTWDRILATGERMSVALVTAGLRSIDVEGEAHDASSLIATNSRFREAEVNHKVTNRQVVQRLGVLPREVVPVVTGFIGADEQSRTTTLGRGGSDYTASLLGAALDAELVEIWTDVDGVLSAEPGMVTQAVPLSRISYGEAAEMAFFGAKVMHPKMMYPLEEKGIPIAIKNTKNPDAAGTLITEEADEDGDVKVVTSTSNVSLLSFDGYGSLDVAEVAQRFFGSLSWTGVQVLLVSHASSEGSTSLVVPTNRADQVTRLVEKEFSVELERNGRHRIRRRDGLAVVAAVGDGIREEPTLGGRLLRSLSRAHIEVLAVSGGASSRNLSVVVNDDVVPQAVSALHHAAVLKKRAACVFVAGATGQVGRALVRQLEESKERIESELQIELRLVGAANSRNVTWDPAGLRSEELDARLEQGESLDLDRLVDRMASCHLEHRLFVDCTANLDVASRTAELLAAGVGCVTPNKLANTSSYADYQRLRSLSRGQGIPYLYETTVGAALPVLCALENLVRSGDRLREVSGVLSGTLSFLFARLNEGHAFSAAVREAKELGYTEPHPKADLGGEDAARKLLILLREAGLGIEWREIEVESLVPEHLADESDPERFLAGLSAVDDAWAERVEAARARGERLVYAARYDGDRPTVGVTAVPEDHPMARLRPTENVVVYHTDRYRDVPLTVTGPGAGPELTASGVLADLVAAARQLVDVERPARASRRQASARPSLPDTEADRKPNVWKVPA